MRYLRLTLTWDTDGDDVDLPPHLDFPINEDIDPEMDLSDTIEELSDMYGYLILDVDVSVYEKESSHEGEEVD
jgi:hypothetical protein